MGNGEGLTYILKNNINILRGKFMGFTVILIIIVVSIVGGFILGKKLTFNKKIINISTIIKEILPISEYASLVYHYSAVITNKDKLPILGRRAIYSIDGAIKLGFNCKEIVINDKYNIITLKMPPIKILSHVPFRDSFCLYDEKTNIFNRYTLEDANKIREDNEKEQEEKVNKNEGLFMQAKASAEQQFKSFLEIIPEIKNKYEIKFEWKKSGE